MKKSDEIRRKTWRMLAKNLIVLAVLAIATIVGVLSWFSSVASAEANNISVMTQLNKGVEVAIVNPESSSAQREAYLSDNSNWISNETAISGENFAFLQNLKMADVTGDGISFIIPPITQSNAVALADTSADWTNNSTERNKQYLSFDIYFRSSTENKKIIMKQDTYYGPLNASASFGNSTSGYSPNTVIGAARLAVIGNANLNADKLTNPSYVTRELLWIPAPQLFYDGVLLHTDMRSGNTESTYYLNSVGTKTYSNGSTVAGDGTYNHAYYADKTQRVVIAKGDDLRNNVTAADAASPDYLLHKDVEVARLTNTLVINGSTYYVDGCRINMWIEGEDSESRSLQVGGEFKANLKFSIETVSN